MRFHVYKIKQSKNHIKSGEHQNITVNNGNGKELTKGWQFSQTPYLNEDFLSIVVQNLRQIFTNHFKIAENVDKFQWKTT